MRILASSIALSMGMIACAAGRGSPDPTTGPTSAATAGTDPETPPCRSHPLAVQVLGSGGPIADDARASSGYVLWVDGKARLVVDFGGGTFLRFAQAGGDASDLEAVLLTHLHVDHTADLPALLKSASFSERSDPLAIVGPSGEGPFPPTDRFLTELVGSTGGAWRYLGGYLTDQGNPFRLAVETVGAQAQEPAEVLRVGDLAVHAVGVAHGIVPALGYAIEVGETRIAFTGDQRMDGRPFRRMARGVDLLVAHHAIPEDAGDAARSLHATPSQIGQLAADVEAKSLVLSHHMARSLRDRQKSQRTLRARYEGPVHFAEDLDCIELAPVGGSEAPDAE